MKIVVLLSLACLGCGRSASVDAGPFTQEVAAFQSQGQKYLGNEFKISELKASVGPLPLRDGYCLKQPGAAPEITVSDVWFAEHREDPDQVEEMIFHELGHCILNRPHTNSRSIMMAALPQDYASNKDFYEAELFLGADRD